MKKIIALIFITVITVKALSQQIQHIVLRGETPQSIAEKYNTSVDALIEENPLLATFFYVGMYLQVPQKETFNDNKTGKRVAKKNASHQEGSSIDSVAIVQAQLDELLERIKITDQYWDEGNEAFAEENYSKAHKKYSKALSIGGDDPDLFYNRALCSLKKNKYNHALEDFRKCLSNDPDDELKEKAESMMELASKLKDERSERRGQLITGAVLVVAGTALAVAEANAMQSYAESGYNPYNISNSFIPSGQPVFSGNDIYSQRDSYYNSEIAKSNMQMMQINNMRMELLRQQQNESNRIFQMNSNALSISFEAVSQYNLNQSKYLSPGDAFNQLFTEKMGRAPSIEEAVFFQNYYMGYLNKLAESESASSSFNLSESSSNSFSFDSDDSFSSSSSNWDYRAEYRQLEDRVKDMFHTWTVIGGTSYEKDGKTNVAIKSNNPTVANTTIFSNILNTQREMAKVRREASKNGITIMPSEWETKRPSIY